MYSNEDIDRKPAGGWPPAYGCETMTGDQFKHVQFLYLTTTGRTSGLPRQIEIWFVSSAGKLYILAEHFHKTQWVRNIEQNPRVKVRIVEQELEATARVLDIDRDQETWQLVQQLAREKYGWGEGLPVEISLM